MDNRTPACPSSGATDARSGTRWRERSALGLSVLVHCGAVAAFLLAQTLTKPPPAVLMDEGVPVEVVDAAALRIRVPIEAESMRIEALAAQPSPDAAKPSSAVADAAAAAPATPVAPAPNAGTLDGVKVAEAERPSEVWADAAVEQARPPDTPQVAASVALAPAAQPTDATPAARAVASQPPTTALPDTPPTAVSQEEAPAPRSIAGPFPPMIPDAQESAAVGDPVSAPLQVPAPPSEPVQVAAAAPAAGSAALAPGSAERPEPASIPAAPAPPPAAQPSPPLQVAALPGPEPPSALRSDAAPTPSGSAPLPTLAVVAPPTTLRPIDPRELVEAALKGLECARVSADVDAGSGTVTLKGHARSEADRLRLASELSSIAGVQRIDDSGLRVLGEPYCRVLAFLDRPDFIRSTEQRQDLTTVGQTNQPGLRRLVGGEALSLTLSAPEFDAYLYVDHFSTDGRVTHLLPTDRPDNFLKADAVFRLGPGERGRRAIASPPYGLDVIVVLASSEPLYTQPRPVAEEASGYLAALDERIQTLRRGGLPLKYEYAYYLVATSPPGGRTN